MSFLLPIFWSAMALGGAIVVFYLIRERPRKQLLSTLLFWNLRQTKIYETPLWRKLRRWVSLLLQLLFLALLVFALARPVANWELSGVRSRVFVLDPSASMMATDVSPSRFAKAKADLRAQIERLRFFDEAALVLASDPPEILSGWTRSRRRLLEGLDRAQPGTKDANVRPALEVARNLVATREKAQVEFFTDGVGGEPPDQALLADVVEHRIGSGQPRNRGLTLFAARRSLVAPGELTLVAQVAATGGQAQEAEIEILRDGTLIDAQSIQIDPRKGWKRSWNVRGDQGGIFSARLQKTEGDQLEADDAAEVAVEALKPVAVAIVSPPDSFLEAVFKAMPGVNAVRVWPADKAGTGDASKLWVFNQAAPPPDFQARGLVMLAPNGSGFWGERRGEMKDPMISEVDTESPLTRFASLDKVRVGRAAEFAPAPGAHVLAASFGSPVLFGKWDRGTHWLVFTFDLEQSDFVLRTAFPILMENVVQSLRAGDAEGSIASLPGLAETRLAPRAAAQTVTPKAEWAAPWTVRPLWWWAVLLGAIWLLAEWWTYHRRITE